MSYYSVDGSRGTNAIGRWLMKHRIQYKVEKTFEGLQGDFAPLRFDFYLPDQNVAIEFDGKQHYFAKFCESKQVFYKQRRYDRLKEEFCFRNHIRLIRIVYDELNQLDEILGFLVE